MKNHAKEKIRLGIVFFILGTLAMPWIVTFTDVMISGTVTSITLSDFSYFEAVQKILYKEPCGLLFLLSECILLMTVIMCVIKMDTELRSDMYQVTDRISIPIPSGEYQHGSAWFLSKKEYVRAFGAHEIDPNNRTIRLLDVYKRQALKGTGMKTVIRTKIVSSLKMKEKLCLWPMDIAMKLLIL